MGLAGKRGRTSPETQEKGRLLRSGAGKEASHLRKEKSLLRNWSQTGSRWVNESEEKKGGNFPLEKTDM